MNKSLLLRAVTSTCVVVAALALALPGRAEEKAAKPKAFTCAVVSVDTKANTLLARRITATTKVSRTFNVDQQTKFKASDNKPFGLGDLKPGDKINVAYIEQGKTLTAVEVALLSAEKKP